MGAEITDFPEVRKWLKGKAEGTIVVYLSGMRAYLEFTEMNPTELIDEAEKDREQKVRYRGKPEGRVMDFNKWLMTEYAQKKRGAGKRQNSGKVGISERMANSYCISARSFYRVNGFKLGGEGALLRLPKSTGVKANSKLQMRDEEVRKMLSVCRQLRDKAIVMFMYQGFQAVGEICSLNYGDVEEGLKRGDDILTIQMVRKKSKTEYHMCVGDEAIDMLKLYLKERVRRGEELKYDSPLFVKAGRVESEYVRVTSSAIAHSFKEMALKSGLVTEERMKIADMNPARPHSLRSSGMTVAKLSGMADVAVEFMSGHGLDGTTQAYWQTNSKELTDLYRKHYDSLRVLKPKLDEEKVKKLETRVMKRDDVIDALIENGKMKEAKIDYLSGEIKTLNERVERFENHVNKWLSKFERADWNNLPKLNREDREDLPEEMRQKS